MGGEESGEASQGDDMDESQKSREMPARPADSIRKWRSTRNWSLFWLTCIAAVSLTGLIISWRGNPTSDTLRFELAKTFMQVLAVAFFGGLATLATFMYQDSRAQENEQSRHAEEKAEYIALRTEEEKERKQERDRHSFENARAERLRQDDQLRSIMDETLETYNQTKRIRRLLEAETNDILHGRLTLAVYDRHMTDLIDEQLAFEKLKRFIPFISDTRLNHLPTSAANEPQKDGVGKILTKSSLVQSYEDIEKYLNHVIDEYKDERHILADEMYAPLAEFGELSRFIGNEFQSNVSARMDDIIKTLLEALWQPLADEKDLKTAKLPRNE
jgi:hypothetical protein